MGKPVPGMQPKAGLSTVRRFEAAGFRAWPASAVHYDGTWVVRLTAGHPAKRLNSVNPLDPGDVHDLPERIMRAGRRFDAYGRPLTFRLSPLAGAEAGEPSRERGLVAPSMNRWSCSSTSTTRRCMAPWTRSR